jgi:APA family basic amino acid/polyamine antiporter
MENSKQENGLKRKLGLFPLSNIVIANMIGAGIFSTSGLLMMDLHHPLLMIVLWIAGGLIALCGAMAYGELGAAMPLAGGEYVFLSKLYRPILGFLSGWVSFFVGFSAPIAASAILFTEYITRPLPGLLRLGIFNETVEAQILKKFYAILLIAVFTLIHRRGVELGAKVQNYLTVPKVILIVGLIFFGFLLGKGDMAHISQGTPFTFDFSGWKTIGLALMWIMFSYAGWNASAYIGSEVKDPKKNMPHSLLLGTGIVMLLYLCLNLLYVYAIAPAYFDNIAPEEMDKVIPIAALAVGNLFGRNLESLLSVFISFVLLSSLSAYIILGPRVYYSMSKDRAFFKFASDVHPKFGVPSKSILLQGIIAIFMAFFGTFDQLLTYMGFSLGIFPILSVLGVFKLRKSNMSVIKLPGFPLTSLVYIIVGVVILFLAFFERPMESSIAIGTVLIGIPVYMIFKSKYK